MQLDSNRATDAPTLSTRKKLLFATVLIVFAYLAAEATCSVLYMRGVLWPESTTYIFEGSRTIRFDPVAGFRLLPETTRFARITWGEICYDGYMRGNNQGFPDRDDFGPARPDAQTRRLALFGDSFSSAQFLSCNWADRVEDMAAKEGARLQILNFSVDGGGLLNWLNILEKRVIADGYELDGVIFAVFNNDLVRGFHIRDDSDPPVGVAGQRAHSLGYVYSWDPDKFPKTLAEAKPDFHQTECYILDHDGFERALRGEWRPVTDRPFRPFLLWRILNKLGIEWDNGLQARKELERAHMNDAEGRRRTYERLAAALKKLGVPVLVVGIPNLPELLGQEADNGDGKREFAQVLGAEFLDGTEPFRKLTPDEVRDHWLHYDHHWNQKGSDLFARFIWEQELNHKWP